MLGIGRLFSNLAGLTSNVKAYFKSNNHQTKTKQKEELPSYELDSPGFQKFIEKLNLISNLQSYEEQKTEREYVLENLLIDFSEYELIDIFSCINFHKGLPKETKSQAVLFLNSILDKKTNMELHDYISSEENSPLPRKLAIFVLIDRRDKTASLTFTWRVIVDTDDTEVRKMAAMGLGEIGGKPDLMALEAVQKTDPIYEEAQKSIGKIKNKLGVM